MDELIIPLENIQLILNRFLCGIYIDTYIDYNASTTPPRAPLAWNQSHTNYIITYMINNRHRRQIHEDLLEGI